jgi:MerR family transcriptional regulator/heat shock protein HspR
MNLYGITAVSRETGIHESSLRRWEEMGLISPDRIDLVRTSVRVYTEEEVEGLKEAKDLMDSGFTLRAAFESVKREIQLYATQELTSTVAICLRDGSRPRTAASQALR